VLLGEFAARGERAGWLSIDRELGERHRDDLRLAEAISADGAALVRRCDTVAAIGEVVERGWRYVRPRRVSVGGIGIEPAYAHGFALALPAQVSVPLLPGRGRPRKYMSMARPTGVGRAIATYSMPIEGRDEWLAAASRLA
jgi:hypothetical protein